MGGGYAVGPADEFIDATMEYAQAAAQKFLGLRLNKYRCFSFGDDLQDSPV